MSVRLVLACITGLSFCCAILPVNALDTEVVPQVMSFNDMRGVRTKWQIAPAVHQDARYTVQPGLNGLSVSDYISRLETAGVNAGDLNIDPISRLAGGSRNHRVSSSQVLSEEDWRRYLADIYQPPNVPASNPQEQNFLASTRDRIAAYGYSPQQRDEALLAFLRQLELSKSRGEIRGTIGFILHQRKWFRSDLIAQRPGYKKTTEQEFASDMSQFINAARAEGLDHWILGVRLGENSNKNMDELLPIIVDLATLINEQTNGWLRTHMMMANGGGWGAVYNGIQNVRSHISDSSGRPFDFFNLISQQTGTFAFGYKWMEWSTDKIVLIGMRGLMKSQQCAGHPCRPGSEADWEEFLRVNEGFDDLEAFIHEYGGQYPRHACVVFVGDSADAVQQLIKVEEENGNGATGMMFDRPALVVLRRMFIEAGKGGGGWTGYMFMNAYSNRDEVGVKHNWGNKRRLVSNAGGPGHGGRGMAAQCPDNGRALYFEDGSPWNFEYGTVSLMPNSFALWRHWPYLQNSGNRRNQP